MRRLGIAGKSALVIAVALAGVVGAIAVVNPPAPNTSDDLGRPDLNPGDRWYIVYSTVDGSLIALSQVPEEVKDFTNGPIPEPGQAVMDVTNSTDLPQLVADAHGGVWDTVWYVDLATRELRRR